MHQHMAKTIHPERDPVDEAAETYREARYPVALTGAGISVDSGIPDFRSPGGLWTVFRPEEYATIETFTEDPAKAWQLYRALGAGLVDKQPSAAHFALAELESADHLKAVITQNIDGLHSQAGSRNVLEVHGEHQNVHCMACGFKRPFEQADLEEGPPPKCSKCGYPLKPNIVLFGEMVRKMPEIDEMLAPCDLLMVIGTSAQVYPVASFPYMVHRRGGLIYEFNKAPTALTHSADFFFEGSAGTSVPALAKAVLK
jgi:NAD-dependent deacetylase